MGTRARRSEKRDAGFTCFSGMVSFGMPAVLPSLALPQGRDVCDMVLTMPCVHGKDFVECQCAPCTQGVETFGDTLSESLTAVGRPSAHEGTRAE